MCELVNQIKKELNRHLQQHVDFNIQIKDTSKSHVSFFVDGNLDIFNYVMLTPTGKVKKNSHRTQSNYVR